DTLDHRRHETGEAPLAPRHDVASASEKNSMNSLTVPSDVARTSAALASAEGAQDEMAKQASLLSVNVSLPTVAELPPSVPKSMSSRNMTGHTISD
ncbi:unnamed protein product, partial [Symbiodinium pilosum]